MKCLYSEASVVPQLIQSKSQTPYSGPQGPTRSRSLVFLQPHLLSLTQEQSALGIQAGKLVLVLGKEALNFDSLFLLFFPSKVVWPKLLPTPSPPLLSLWSLQCYSLNSMLFLQKSTWDYYYYSNQVNVTSSQRSFMTTLHEMTWSSN